MFHILNQGELAFCTKRGGTVYLRVGMVMYTWGRRYIRGGGVLQTRVCGLSVEMYCRSEGGGMPVGGGTPYQ